MHVVDALGDRVWGLHCAAGKLNHLERGNAVAARATAVTRGQVERTHTDLAKVCGLAAGLFLEREVRCGGAEYKRRRVGAAERILQISLPCRYGARRSNGARHATHHQDFRVGRQVGQAWRRIRTGHVTVDGHGHRCRAIAEAERIDGSGADIGRGNGGGTQQIQITEEAAEPNFLADDVERIAPILDLRGAVAQLHARLRGRGIQARQRGQQQQPQRHADHQFDQRHPALQTPQRAIAHHDSTPMRTCTLMARR